MSRCAPLAVVVLLLASSAVGCVTWRASRVLEDLEAGCDGAVEVHWTRQIKTTSRDEIMRVHRDGCGVVDAPGSRVRRFLSPRGGENLWDGQILASSSGDDIERRLFFAPLALLQNIEVEDVETDSMHTRLRLVRPQKYLLLARTFDVWIRHDASGRDEVERVVFYSPRDGSVQQTLEVRNVRCGVHVTDAEVTLPDSSLIRQHRITVY